MGLIVWREKKTQINKAGVAQLVELLLCKQLVAGSSPVSGPKMLGGGVYDMF